MSAPPRSVLSHPRESSSLPPRTLAGFAAATIAIVVMAYVSYTTYQRRANAAQLRVQTQATMRDLDELLSSLKDAETGQRGYLLTGEEGYLEPYDRAVAGLPRAIAHARLSLVDDKGQSERLDEVERVTAEKLVELRETIDLKRAGKEAAALSMVRADRGRQLMDRLRALTGEMGAIEAGELEALTKDWDSAVALTSVVTWGGSGVLLFLVFMAAFMSGRDFRAQRAHAWIRATQSELALRMQEEPDLGLVGESVARVLSAALEAPLVAVYGLTDERAPQLLGSSGLDDAARALAEAAGGGLARQAIAEKRVLHIEDVPADFFAIRSGLGGRRPSHVLVAPTISDGVANGVVELALFRKPDTSEHELLSLVGESIGAALRAAKYRADLRKLLSETQRQAEELKSQEEELRVSNEELEQQTRALQGSQEQLRNQAAELEQINAQLEEGTQSLERQRDELERTQQDLTRSSAYKSEFLANMSHELRTPLNSSLILARLLAENRDGNLNAEQIKFAQTIYAAGNDLLTLINDILDLARIEAGKLEVRPETLTFARIVDDTVRTFEPIAREKGVAFVHTCAPELPPSITTDATRLAQILKNLLSNAFKFTTRGEVSLHLATTAGGRVTFAVRDSGIGIAPEQHEVIFEAFRQADGTTNRRFGGTGLGLSISRDLARLLGGDLRVTSSPGQGSTFTLELPVRYVPSERPVPASALTPPPADAQAPRLPRASTPIAVPPGAVPPGALPDDRAALKAGDRAILIVEDELSFATILQGMARDRAWRTLVATTADEGLRLAVRHRPSAIVLDLGLPDRSGLTVLDALKHDATTRHIPVHVISASDASRAAFEMGAAGYAVKPVQMEQIGDAMALLESKLAPGPRRVLVVEDDDVHRESTCQLLANDQVECVGAATADDALARLREATFDCMVLDLSLPGKTGFDLLDEMSASETNGFPPVIVYTGRALTSEEEQALRRVSSSIIIKGARSPERLLDEVTLFLHQVESDLPADRQRMLRDARHRESVFENRRVLVVEDDVRNIFALTSVLEPRGAKVEIARNGKEALAHLDAHPGVDLVLMDVMMPEMDGLACMREIRKQPALARLPIIALTAKAMADDRERCLTAGASDYIAKPLEVDKLLSLARVWMPK